jgi:hypothetical protein
MIVTDISDRDDYPSRIRSEADELGLVRSQNTLHLTSIIRDMAETIALNPRDPITEQELAFYGAGGFMWEKIWSTAHAQSIGDGELFRPGEIERDGIVGSPDVLDLSISRLIELKCRWMSASKFDSLEKNFFWELLQIKCYLAMLGWVEAELTVFFVAGNWRPPIPCVRSVLLEFTEREVEEGWNSVLDHARRKGWVE